MRGHWIDFAKWLLNGLGTEVAAKQINKYLPFFMTLERQWGAIPDYSELLSYFGAEGLRKYLRAARWLEESKLIAVNKAAKDEDSERRMIETQLSSLTLSPSLDEYLAGFVDFMKAKVERKKTSVKSMRLALTPAIGLLRQATSSDGEIEQDTVIAYLNRRSGQRAALSGFIGFLNREHGFDLKLPSATSLKPSAHARRKVKLKLIELLDAASEYRFEDEEQWLKLSLSYFHWISEHKARVIVANAQPVASKGGYEFHWKGDCFWIPNRSFRVDI